jgi:hypothetical protein
VLHRIPIPTVDAALATVTGVPTMPVEFVITGSDSLVDIEAKFRAFCAAVGVKIEDASPPDGDSVVLRVVQ